MESLISEFVRYFHIQGKSPQTLRTYGNKLRQFFREAGIQEPHAIRREKVTEAIALWRDRKVHDKTVANHLWALKAFLKWLREEKKMEVYHLDVAIPYDEGPAHIEYLEPEELKRLFSVIDTETVCGLRLRSPYQHRVAALRST
jgi:site-specific recombinase XerD